MNLEVVWHNNKAMTIRIKKIWFDESIEMCIYYRTTWPTHVIAAIKSFPQ